MSNRKSNKQKTSIIIISVLLALLVCGIVFLCVRTYLNIDKNRPSSYDVETESVDDTTATTSVDTTETSSDTETTETESDTTGDIFSDTTESDVTETTEDIVTTETTETTVPINYVDLVVKYYYHDGTEAKGQDVFKLPENEEYEIVVDCPEGYVAVPSTLTGTASGEETKVVLFVEDYSEPVEESYTLVINYLYEDKTVATKAYVNILPKDFDYSITSPYIKNYKADKSVVTGNIDRDTTIDVIYSKNDEEYVHEITHAISRRLTIKYEYEGDEKPFTSLTQTYPDGGAYRVNSPVIEGYRPDVWIVAGVLGSDTEITVTYYKINVEEPKKETITIKYQYEDGSEVTSSKVLELDRGEKYDVESPFVDGYAADLPKITGYCEGSYDVVVTYSPLKFTLKVQYVYSDGKLPSYSFEKTYDYNSSYDIPSPSVKGYTADKDVKGTIVQDETITVTYTPNTYVLTIKYLYSGGSVMRPTQTKKLHYMDTYSIDSPVVEGYIADRKNVCGVITQDTTINVYYSENLETYYTIRVQYVDDVTGKEIYGTYENQFKAGELYVVSSPAITGYNADKASITGNATSDAYFEVRYSKKTYKLKIVYTYEDGSKQSSSKELEYTYGSDYLINSPAVEGYKADIEVVSGKLYRNETITVNYSKQIYSLTINYKYENGGEASITYNKQAKYGFGYKVFSPSVKGHSPDIGVVEGELTKDTTISVIYKRNTYVVMVNFIYEDGSTATYSLDKNDYYGTQYSFQSPVIDGYTPSEEIIEGTIEGPALFTVVYKQNTYNLIIRCVDEKGKPLTQWESISKTVPYGNTYAVVMPQIKGYYPESEIITGTISKDTTIDVVYKIRSYEVKVNYYFANTEDKAFETVTKTVKYNESYTIPSESLEGYNPSVAKVSGIGSDSIDINVYYYPKTVSINVKYNYENGGSAASKANVKVSYNDTYCIKSPAVKGHLASENFVSGKADENQTYTVTFTVTYVPNKYSICILYLNENYESICAPYYEVNNYGYKYKISLPLLEGYEVISGSGIEGTLRENVFEIVYYREVIVEPEETTDETADM